MPTLSYADLSKAINCHKNIENTECASLLIGQIDALYNLGLYCPDGKTSYKLILISWARDIQVEPQAETINSTENLIKTLRKLNLICYGK